MNTDDLRTTASKDPRLKGTQVVGDDGLPLIVYHGTGAVFKKFEKGDIGFHFSVDPDIANKAAGLKYGAGGEKRTSGETPNIVPVFLNIKNPAELSEPEEGEWASANVVLELLYDSDIVDKEEYEQLADQFDTYGNDVKVLQQVLKKKGYDGIQYQNEYETSQGQDKRCFIAFDSDQIVSIFDVKDQVEEAITSLEDQDIIDRVEYLLRPYKKGLGRFSKLAKKGITVQTDTTFYDATTGSNWPVVLIVKVGAEEDLDMIEMLNNSLRKIAQESYRKSFSSFGEEFIQLAISKF